MRPGSARLLRRLALPVQVAADEASHFSLLAARLEQLGSSYGALPAHDG